MKWKHEVDTIVDMNGVKVFLKTLNNKWRLILLILLSVFVVSCNEVVRHKVQNRCTVCHGTRKERALSGPTRLIEGVPKLCYYCHTNYTKSSGFMHIPVAGGQCLNCHNPHESKYKHLLKEPEPQLCYQCHNVTAYFIYEPFVHGPVATGQCVVCHNAHQSENKYLLKEPESKLCRQCHEIPDDLALAPFVHGPVSVGRCLFCHNSHQSKNEHLLKEREPELCYQCHIVKEIEMIPAHLTKLSFLCTDCHEAHESSLKYLLKVLQN